MQPNTQNSYAACLSAGTDGFAYIDNRNLLSQEVTRFQFIDNGAIQLVRYRNSAWELISNIITSSGLDSGVANATVSQNVTAAINVAFNKPFPAIPVVVATPSTLAPNVVTASVRQVTKTGFTLYVRRTDTANAVDVHWIAICK